MELGIYTFADIQPDGLVGKAVNTRQRMKDLLDMIRLAARMKRIGRGSQHKKVLKSMALFGMKVIPAVKKTIGIDNKPRTTAGRVPKKHLLGITSNSREPQKINLFPGRTWRKVSNLKGRWMEVIK